jgi:hypothetical protein
MNAETAALTLPASGPSASTGNQGTVASGSKTGVDALADGAAVTLPTAAGADDAAGAERLADALNETAADGGGAGSAEFDGTSDGLLLTVV